MKAVVFKEPFEVVVEEQPVPSVQDPGDVIITVLYAGLCGSDLHIFRVCLRPGRSLHVGLMLCAGIGSMRERFCHGEYLFLPHWAQLRPASGA